MCSPSGTVPTARMVGRVIGVNGAMLMRGPRWLTVLIFLTLIVPSGIPARAADAPGSVPRFEAGACPFDLASDQIEGTNVFCGYLIVPESHAAPTGKTLRLAVIRIKSASPTPAADPIVYLEGGPGGSINDGFLGFLTGNDLAKYTATRDFILFDQRGVGKSEPNLRCPEVDAQTLRDIDTVLAPMDGAEHQLAALRACRDRLVGQGINLQNYNSIESAADVNDLRVALGLDTIDLFGTSYGTRVALTVMRDFPQIVRSAVLDSNVPLEANLVADEPADMDNSIRQLFATCTMSASCKAKYPNLQGDFSAVVKQLTDQPLHAMIHNTADNKDYEIVATGNDIGPLIAQVLYIPQSGAIVPQLLAQLKERKTTLLVKIVEAFIIPGPDIAIGLYESVYCTEETPFNDEATTRASVATIMPELQAQALADTYARYQVCKDWPVTPLSRAETLPVTAKTPSLVLSSANDPATPPRYGQALANDLPNSYYIPFPALGHVVAGGGGSCAATIITSFVIEPTTKPPTTCVAGVSASP